MIIFQFPDINRLAIAACKELIASGRARSARGLDTLEIGDVVALVLEDPCRCIITLPARRTKPESYRYLEREFEWYLSGSRKVSDICFGSSLWNKIANADGTVNSNYGFIALIEEWNGKSQYQWCAEKLKEDPHTRQAIINYSQPRDKYIGNADFVCTVGQQFILRDGCLDSVVWMRANDIIKGLATDVPWFTYLQRKIAKEIGCALGKYTHLVTSLHAYVADLGVVEKIAKTQLQPEDDRNASLIWNLWQKYTDEKASYFYSSLFDEEIIVHDTV